MTFDDKDELYNHATDIYRLDFPKDKVYNNNYLQSTVSAFNSVTPKVEMMKMGVLMKIRDEYPESDYLYDNLGYFCIDKWTYYIKLNFTYGETDVFKTLRDIVYRSIRNEKINIIIGDG